MKKIIWESQYIPYTKALSSISKAMDCLQNRLNAFDASTILSFMFDKEKEEIIDDIMEYRKDIT